MTAHCLFDPRIDAASLEAAVAAELRRCLHTWVEFNCRHYGRGVTLRMARDTEPYLNYLLDNNYGKSPEELEDIASWLSPGGVHNGGAFLNIIMNNGVRICPRLKAAILYGNWDGGKTGFQFLPDPANTEVEEYALCADDLIEALGSGTGGDPRAVLTGVDREFYESLPDRLTIYRGCAGVSFEHAQAGVCWTTSRPVAEWFAWRATRRGTAPILLTARVRKKAILLALASEFEVVVRVSLARRLICRNRQVRPVEWHPPSARSTEAA